MSAKPIFLASVLLIFFVSATHSARQKSGNNGLGFAGYGKGGVVRPTVTCKEKGPCNGKKLRCPARCFSSFSRSGKGYGGGGGGGGCTMDCKKKCIAYC
ncbi:hypothetical protein F2Q70_00032871 [Brassica cretica]|uniref:Uncharacterized protein n=2 Tax=Brassica cretica TaxID=69181 RepID=A0A8S9H1J2_BRACR|nr:hypothetical protein F2Q70_00032871 [Brassica cretica]KAF2550906.1 hypothetical protein F2Q68_00037247 [Brassica cretica]KAF3486152.1 hypothetical protein F2Q69_00057156 [Brassica cretica]KAF3590273.1 hypothetical protein DY000_02027016 [Brassica cretica]